MSAKADTWMPFYVADYLRATMRLTRDQHGAYFLLLLACWDGGGKLPRDPGQLAAIAKATPAEWRKLAPVILPYFEEHEDHLIHDRVVKEHEKAAKLSQTRKEVGAKGGRPRKQTESKDKPIGSAKANQNGLQNKTPACVALPSQGKNSAPPEQRVLTHGASAAACLEGAAEPTPDELERRKEVAGLMANLVGELGVRRVEH